MKPLSPAEITRAIGRMLEAAPDRNNDAEVERYWQLLTDVSFAMARFAGVSNRKVAPSRQTFNVEIGAGAENLEPYADTPARLRAEAQALLTEAQAVDQLFPFLLHHAQQHSNTTYVTWAPSEPSDEQAASVLLHEYVKEDHDLSISGPIALSEITGTDQRLVIGGESEDARVQAAPSTFDDSQAMREGWFITDDPTPQLQKLDEDQVFKDDAAAWIFVCQQAQGGSEYHQKALEHMEQHNPREYNAIMAHGAPVDDLSDEPSDEEVAAPTC